MATEQITTWATAVGNEFGIEVSQYVKVLLDNGEAPSVSLVGNETHSPSTIRTIVL